MENLNFFKVCSEDDATDWIKKVNTELILPENLSIDDAKKAANEYFNKNFGNNAEYLPQFEENINEEEARKIYEVAFIKQATFYLKELRRERDQKESEITELRESFNRAGEAEAAKWFTAINDASFAPNLTTDEIKQVAIITYNSIFPDLNDNILKNYFLVSFVNHAKTLLKTLKD